MRRALAFGVVALAGACGGSGSGGPSEVRGPTASPPAPGSPAPNSGSYMCFRVDAPATKTMPAGPRALCTRSVDDCQLARRTVLDAIARELGPNAGVPATECTPSPTAYCTAMTDEAGLSSNVCTPDTATCNVLKANMERDGKLKGGDCMEFPASRLDLLAVRPIDFHMWCYRDQRSAAASDCESTKTACDHMVNAMASKGYVKPRTWADGSVCAQHDKVVCYAQLNRIQEQVKFICTPSFDECQARASEVRGADFEVVGSCGVVTGNKPW